MHLSTTTKLMVVSCLILHTHSGHGGWVYTGVPGMFTYIECLGLINWLPDNLYYNGGKSGGGGGGLR